MSLLTEFLVYLKDAASSTIALVGYIVVALSWTIQIWLRYRPQQKAKQILEMYKSDRERTKALGTLLGSTPPQGLSSDDILTWTSLQLAQRTRLAIVAAYGATLLTAIAIVSMALFQPMDSDNGKKPSFVDVITERPTPPK